LTKSNRIQVTALALALALLTIACGGSQSGGGGGSSATLTLSYKPPNMAAYPGTTFLLNVTANATGTSAAPTISLGILPAGITTTTSFPLNVSTSGTNIDFEIAATVAAGSCSIPITGTAGPATAQISVPLTISSGTPSQAYFIRPLFGEIGVTSGGSSSVQIQILGNSLYELALGVSGLPQGISATISPQLVQAGDTFTVTITASSSAPVAQNVEWTITGTPSASVPASTLTLLLDVTLPSGIGWTNRTMYVSTRATPFSAAYDPVHQLIYSSNQTWNRVDVISNATHSLVRSLPVRDPRGLDISIDQKTVWVSTGSQVMYGIDTATLHATRYQLPRFVNAYNPSGTSWEGWRVLSLADGTLMLGFSTATGSGIGYSAVWDPTANTLTELPVPTGGLFARWQLAVRSGDGKHLFSIGDDSAEVCFSYDVLTKTVSNAVQIVGYAISAAASPDGSRIAIADANGFNLYDSSFNLLGPLPGDGGYGSTIDTIDGWIFGGAVFSPDGTTLYEETGATIVPVIISIDVASLQPTALAPAMPVIPVMVELSPPFYLAVPFAVDSSGMVLGIQYHGIAFDDALARVNFVTNQSGSPTFLQHMSPYSGPMSGGTTSGGFGNAFSLTPDVYFGSNKGSGTVSQGDLQITSPPASVSGPVDVKMLFPDGVEVYDPQFFTYGTSLQDVILSGGPPQGNVASTLDAFGLPTDPTQDVVAIGANHGTVTSTQTQYPPFSGEQTATFLNYTVPPGSPGWADVTVTTSNGTGTLSKAFFYAKSVTDFATSDTPSFILYDQSRNQLYLSAGDHIDVFSLASNSFSTPLQPPSLGTTKQFQGLALTPDKKNLLVADLLDGSLAVIDLDTPSNSFAVNMPQSVTVGSCGLGPLFVAADNVGEGIVVTGGVIGTGCGPGGGLYLVNLASGTTTTTLPGCTGGTAYESATADGSLVALAGWYSGGSFQLYSTAQHSCLPSLTSYMQYGGTAAADGNVFATLRAFIDADGNMLGRMGTPPVFYPGRNSAVYYNYSPYQDGALQNPALNDAGSLYFWAYPNHIDIVDVQHGMPRLRLSLAETVSNVVSPMAIDSGGQHIYLITSAGLTIVDLGQAPLSIGHLSQTDAGVGAQIQVRGSGLESGIAATLGGKSAAVTYVDPQTLTFTVPPVSSGLQDLKLTNLRGTTYTLENAVTVH
jgi:hypothetical protein